MLEHETSVCQCDIQHRQHPVLSLRPWPQIGFSTAVVRDSGVGVTGDGGRSHGMIGQAETDPELPLEHRVRMQYRIQKVF